MSVNEDCPECDRPYRPALTEAVVTLLAEHPGWTSEAERRKGRAND